MNLEGKARRNVRIAIALGVIPCLFEYGWFLVYDYGNLFYPVGVLFGGIALVVGVPMVWHLAFPLLKATSLLLHFLVGRRVAVLPWQDAMFESLWTLPVAALMGAITWLIYSFGEFGGWPDDVIFGAVANFIGAFCYFTLAWKWWLLARGKSPNNPLQLTRPSVGS